MASKLSPTSRDGAPKRATEGSSEPSPPRRERTDSRPAPASQRQLSEIPPPATKAPATFDPSWSRETLIATAAYYRAEKRGFQCGHETEDWLAAEREIDRTGTAPIG
jgi:Protein of unknown function (DUF2934)